MWKNISLFIFFCLAFFVLPVGSLAQTYVFEGPVHNSFTTSQVISHAENKQYIYGYLSRGIDTADYYTLDFTEYSPQVQLSLLVPDNEQSKTFRPSLIFTDSGLSKMFGELPFGFSANIGGRVYVWDENTEDKIKDAAVSENLLQGPSFIKDFSQKQYTIAVYDPAGRGGRYVIAVGNKITDRGFSGFFEKIVAYLRVKFSLY